MYKLCCKSSSPAGLNKTQYYKDKKGFQYLDIKAILEIYFKKLPSIQKYQHFFFEAINLALVEISQIKYISNQTKFGQNSTKFDQIWPTLKIRQKSDKIQLIRFVIDLTQIGNHKI